MSSPCDTCTLYPCIDGKEIPKVNRYCPFYHSEPKPMTHFDEIKEMSAEELAQWIDHMQVDAYARGLMGEPVVDYPNSYSGWIDWLRSTADKEER